MIEVKIENNSIVVNGTVLTDGKVKLSLSSFQFRRLIEANNVSNVEDLSLTVELKHERYDLWDGLKKLGLGPFHIEGYMQEYLLESIRSEMSPKERTEFILNKVETLINSVREIENNIYVIDENHNAKFYDKKFNFIEEVPRCIFGGENQYIKEMQEAIERNNCKLKNAYDSGWFKSVKTIADLRLYEAREIERRKYFEEISWTFND